GRREVAHAELGDVALEVVEHLLGHRIGERAGLAVRRDDVVDGREGALGVEDPQPAIPQHGERLWRGDLVDEMQPHQELILARGEPAHGMGVEDLLVERAAHGASLAWRGAEGPRPGMGSPLEAGEAAGARGARAIHMTATAPRRSPRRASSVLRPRAVSW